MNHWITPEHVIGLSTWWYFLTTRDFEKNIHCPNFMHVWYWLEFYWLYLIDIFNQRCLLSYHRKYIRNMCLVFKTIYNHDIVYELQLQNYHIYDLSNTTYHRIMSPQLQCSNLFDWTSDIQYIYFLCMVIKRLFPSRSEVILLPTK